MNVNMHATTEQLLEIKDGFSNGVSAHVESCKICQDELAELRCLNSQMFDTLDEQPRPEVWNRILATLEMEEDVETETVHVRGIRSFGEHLNVPVELLTPNPSQLNNTQSLSKAIYSLAASVLVTGFIGLYVFGQQGSTNQQAALLQANIQELMLNSRGMELALQKVAFQNELLSSSEQSAAERLYWRLTYVDQRIQENSASSEIDPERIRALWNERIEALSGLNQIYYQRQQEFDDSEI